VDIAKKNCLLDNVTLEYKTTTFSRNVGKRLPVTQKSYEERILVPQLQRLENLKTLNTNVLVLIRALKSETHDVFQGMRDLCLI
jgi:hypothetical protein